MSQFLLLFREWLVKPRYDSMHGAVLVEALGKLSLQFPKL